MFRLCLVILFATSASVLPAATTDFTVADPALKVVLIDSDPKESFLGMQLDSAGRLFVGGREALFVYEPAPGGLYQPRRELLRFPEHTWIYDIAIRGDDLYVLTVSALYRIPGAVKQRTGLKPERLLWGMPLGHVHQCFHGLAIGPEGDLYVQHGDPLWYYGDFNRPDHWGHWTWFTADGKQTPFTGVGGVLRIKPDGSGLQVFTRGQRNSCGLAFDKDWNLFSNDNDHEGMPAEYVPGKLLHLTAGAYFSWPRGWMREKNTNRVDILPSLNTNLGRFVPVGQAYYNDPFLPAHYRHSLLVARWCTRAVPNYPITTNGASFLAEEKPFLTGQNDARPVSVTVGRGGRVFVSVAHMAHNEGSPVYRSDVLMVTRADDPANAPFEGYEETAVPDEKLWGELGTPSWSRRYRAHIELNRRGGQTLADAATLLPMTRVTAPSVPHLIWLAGASGSPTAQRALGFLLDEKRETLRLQTFRVLTEFPKLGMLRRQFLQPISKEENLLVRHAALLGLSATATNVASEVIEGPLRSTDARIQQTAALLLARLGTVSEIETQAATASAERRTGGILAAGFRLTLPPATAPLPVEVPLDASRTNDYVLPFAEGKADLRTFGRVGNFTTAEWWRAVKRTDVHNRLFAALERALEDKDHFIRFLAAHFLHLLNDPRVESKVAKVFAADKQRIVSQLPNKKLTEAWFIGPFADSGEPFTKVHAPETGPVDLSKTHDAGGKKLQWRKIKQTNPESRGLFKFQELLGPAERASFYAHFRIESPSAQPAMLLLGSDDGVKLWQNGRVIWENKTTRAALPYQDPLMIELQPGANDFLVRVQNNTDACGLFVDHRLPSDAQIVLPMPMGDATLAERLKSAGGAVPAEILERNWSAEALKGDRERGRALYTSLACAGCHAIKANASSGGGPSLADAAKRFTVPYLVESIVAPNKTVSPVFRWTALTLKNGDELNGLVVGETGEKIELLLTTAARQSVDKAHIQSRQMQDRSPMPEGLVRNAAELRDLLAFILTEAP